MPPIVFALNRLFPKRGDAPLATGERLVVLVIVRAMSFDGGERIQLLSQLSNDRPRAGNSVVSLKRALLRHGESRAPYRTGRGQAGREAILMRAIASRWSAIPNTAGPSA